MEKQFKDKQITPGGYETCRTEGYKTEGVKGRGRYHVSRLFRWVNRSSPRRQGGERMPGRKNRNVLGPQTYNKHDIFGNSK